MKSVLLHLLLLVVVALSTTTTTTTNAFNVTDHNVVWTDLLPSNTTQTFVNTMPIGNGRLSSLVWWSPAFSSVSAMFSSASAWTEDALVAKMGLVNMTISPNPFPPGSSAFFHQELHLDTATVTFLLGGTSNTSYAVRVDAYVNSGAPMVNNDGTSQDDLIVFDVTPGPGAEDGTTYTVEAVNAQLRPEPHTYTAVFECSPSTVSADVVADSSLANGVAWYHRNPANTPYFMSVLESENIAAVAKTVDDPLSNRTFGAVLFTTPASSAVKESPTTVKTTVPAQIGIAASVSIAATSGDWLAGAEAVAKDGIPDKTAHNAFWAAKWDKSYVSVNVSVVARQFTLQRYVQLLQGLGQYPIRFNGMLFTALKPPAQDTRQWGGHNWWQNVRHPYYNMLAQGDGDMLLASLLSWYNSTLELATVRTAVYYPEFPAPAAFWPEYTSLFGTTHPNSYGCGRQGKTDPPIQYSADRWNHYNNQGALDLALLALDYYSWTGDDASVLTLMPLMSRVVNFYRFKFNNTDSDGNMVIYPTQSCETWQCPNYPPSEAECVTNDAPTVAGLRAVLTHLLQLPAKFVSPTDRTTWTTMLGSLPPVPVNATSNALSPGERLPPGTSNVENTELYPVHPYRLFTTAKYEDNNSTEMQQALNAFSLKRFGSDVGWNQNALDAALLGLAPQARSYVYNRASTAPAGGYRFPAFMPHFQDYPPSADHLAVFSTSLTLMLMQPKDDVAGSVVLLPTWPCDWDVDFKLWAPQNTLIEGSVKDTKVTYTVTPSSRASAVTVRACQ